MSTLDDFDRITAGRYVKDKAPDAAGKSLGAFDKLMGTKGEPEPAPKAPPTQGDSIVEGLKKGAGAIVYGTGQLIGEGWKLTGKMTGAKGLQDAGQALIDTTTGVLKSNEADNAPFAEAHPWSNAAGEAAGNAIATGPAAFAGGVRAGAGAGYNLFGRMMAGAGAGAASGALEGVTDDEAFWSEKAKQVATGAAVGGAGVPVIDAIGKAVKATGNAVMRTLRNVTGSADKAVDAAEAKVSDMLVPSNGNRIVPKPSFTDVTPISQMTNAKGQLLLPAPGKAGPTPHNAETIKAVEETLAQAGEPLPAATKQVIRDVALSGNAIDLDATARMARADQFGIKLTQGQAKRDGRMFTDEQNMRKEVGGLMESFAEQHAKLHSGLDNIRLASAPEATASDAYTAGQHIIDGLSQVSARNKAATSAAYAALRDANGGQFPMDGAAWAGEVGRRLEREMKGPYLPKEIQNIIGAFGRGEQQMTFEHFENLRSMLAAEARKAKRADDGNVASAVNMARDALENMPINGAENLKALADQARKLARTDFARREASSLYDDVSTGGAVPDTVIKKIMGEKAEPVANLAYLLRDSPEALQTVRSGVLDEIKQRVTLGGGSFSQDKMNKAVRELGPKLDILFDPPEAQRIRDLAQVAKDVLAAPPASAVNSSNTYTAMTGDNGPLRNILMGGIEQAGNAVTGRLVPLGSMLTGSADKAAQAARSKRVMAEIWDQKAAASKSR